MTPQARRPLWRDLTWPIGLASLPPLVTVAVISWEHLASTNWGLATVGYEDRTTFLTFLGACAGAAGALLGFVVAAIAILVTLPDSKAMTSLRAYSGWRVLEYSLLATGLDLLILLTVSLAAIIVGGRLAPTFVTVYAPTCVVGLGVTGILFTLVLLNVERDRQRYGT